MVERIRSQRGSALVLTLLTVTLAIILVSGFLRASGAEKRHAAVEHQTLQAYYVAESGLNTVINHPGSYAANLPTIPGDKITVVTGGEVNELDESGDPVDQVGTYTVTITRLNQPNMYLFESIGTTPFGIARAAADVNIILNPWFADDAVAIIGSSMGLDWTVPGNAGDGQGNVQDIAYRFEDGSMYVHGSLVVTEPNRGSDTLDIFNGAFVTTDDTVEFIARHPWLDGKHVHWADPDEFPDPADEIREALEDMIPLGPYTMVSATNGFKRVEFPADTKAMYSGRFNDNATVIGGGVFNIQKTNVGDIRIDELILTGDLILIPNRDIWIGELIHQDIQDKPQGHRLIIISDHKIWFSAQSNTNWTPFPPQASEYEMYHFGAGSILWSATGITVTGEIRPMEGMGDTSLGFGVPKEAIWDWSSLAMITKSGDMRFRLFKSPGLVYAGGSITAYDLRLYGTAIIREPLRGGAANPTLGMANCHITYNHDALASLGLHNIQVNSKLRRQ